MHNSSGDHIAAAVLIATAAVWLLAACMIYVLRPSKGATSEDDQ